ncbi:f-box tpr repeat pof3 [Fusarium longipes]|uniref:F-box tpr repeat pof3 n=1 Tax=Fusarium longipes TaxID=694270 RepID=A0A395RH00_9HYPO|nr:f-box tpr repeat pof3 [Fusarium longipes]
METQEEAIAEGRRLYGARQFKPALRQFTIAMQLTFNKCDNKLHIQALDYRAATFEDIKELERAQKDAEWMLELAPRLPDGYLRLGKILRLQKKHEFAWKVYNAGIEMGSDHHQVESPKFKKLRTARQPLHTRFYRRDLLENPPEIIQRIFRYLDFPTLVRCTRVSKGWRRYLSSHGNERLWRTLWFTNKIPFNRPPGIKSIKKLISYSGKDARHIIIDDISRFRLNQQKLLILLQGSKNLERLVLKGSVEEDLSIPDTNGILKKLNHITLQDILMRKPQILSPLLRHASESLQSLYINGLPQTGSYNDLRFPHLPNLQYLRLDEFSRPGIFRLDIWQIAHKTPCLQQLYLQDVQLSAEILHNTGLDDYWPGLRAVTIHGPNDLDLSTARTIQQLTSLRGGRVLQYIDFDFRWKPDDEGPLGVIVLLERLGQEPGMLTTEGYHEHYQYTELRSLRLRRATINPLKLQKVLVDALAGQKLHTLDLTFPLDHRGAPEGSASTQHIHDHAWLRGDHGIKCIGLSEFRFRAYPKTDDEMYLPGFLASFPNLEILEINSSHYDPREFCTMIEAILKTTHLQKIYQKTVLGDWRDKLAEATKKQGVELIWGDRPREWPLVIKDGC